MLPSPSVVVKQKSCIENDSKHIYIFLHLYFLYISQRDLTVYFTSLSRIKLTLEGIEEEEDDEENELSPSSLHKMTSTLEISMISANGYKSRHSQPECGYALEPSQWTEYSIHTMDPDNLELTFEFFEVMLMGILLLI